MRPRLPLPDARCFHQAEDYFPLPCPRDGFIAPFLAGLRVVAARWWRGCMHWPRFFIANAAGGLAWAVTVGLLGYFLGRGTWELLHDWLSWAADCLAAPPAVGLLYLVVHASEVTKEVGK